MKLALKRLLSYFPTKLPVGLTQFHQFADSIIELSGKYADEDSLKFAIASMIIHLPAGTGAMAKNHFVTGLRKSAANQVASQVFQDIKNKQAEVTATNNVKATSDSGSSNAQKETQT